jgi:hypothetical protein
MLMGNISPLDAFGRTRYLLGMNAQPAPSSSAPRGSEVDYTDRQYWNGLIKMSLSKFFILCVLNQRRLHGYEISKAVEETTQGCCSPTPGDRLSARRRGAGEALFISTHILPINISMG